MEQEPNSITNDFVKSEIDKDCISKLPDDVLRHILLIHPLDSGSKAVALLTGLFYRPWISTVKTQDIESVIGDFLFRFDEKNPVKTPRKLEFHFSKDLIMTVLPYGSKRKLNLDFSKGYQELPRKFWWEIVLNTRVLAYSSLYPSSFKTLRLTSVNYLSCKLVSSLISKFRHVRSLIIKKCNGLRILRVEGLTKLVNLSILDCVGLEHVYVVASELKSFQYSGFLCSISLNNATKLKNVKLDFRGQGFNELNCQLYNPLILDTRYVKVLTLHGWMFKIETRSYSAPCVGEHESTTEVEKGQLLNLKLVKMEGFDKEVDIMLFKEHLMEVFSVEPYVVEVRKGMNDRYLFKIPKGQANGKAPESKKLKFCYKFVEIIEDVFLGSKHPHMP